MMRYLSLVEVLALHRQIIESLKEQWGFVTWVL